MAGLRIAQACACSEDGSAWQCGGSSNAAPLGAEGVRVAPTLPVNAGHAESRSLPDVQTGDTLGPVPLSWDHERPCFASWAEVVCKSRFMYRRDIKLDNN